MDAVYAFILGLLPTIITSLVISSTCSANNGAQTKFRRLTQPPAARKACSCWSCRWPPQSWPTPWPAPSSGESQTAKWRKAAKAAAEAEAKAAAAAEEEEF